MIYFVLHGWVKIGRDFWKKRKWVVITTLRDRYDGVSFFIVSINFTIFFYADVGSGGRGIIISSGYKS